MNSDYQSSLEIHERLVQTMSAISAQLASLEGTSRQCLADKIFSKLYSHAHAIHLLAPKPNSKAGTIWDLSSSAALTRVLIETYDALAYIALDEMTEDEFRFRKAVMGYHSLKKRIDFHKRIGSNQQAAELENDAKNIKEQLLKPECLAFWGSKSQRLNEIKKNDGRDYPHHLDKRELNKARGVNHEKYSFFINFLSQHVHSYGMAIEILFDFEAGEEKSLIHMEKNLDIASLFLSKAILGMFSLFPNIKQPNEQSRLLLEKLSQPLITQ
jgi:hypothetical protein